jgi:tetratricopeptide (TPR) repeat protein
LVQLATGDLEAAKAKFLEALRLDPSLNEATYHLGTTLMQQGKLEEAKERFLAVYKKDASFPGLAEGLGELYVKLGSFKEAALSYDRALEVDRPSIETRLGAAKAYNLAAEYEKALKQTEKVLEDQPTESRARALRAEARLGQEKLDDALVEIRQAVDRDRRADYLVIMGRIHAARKEYADAIDAYKDALKIEPTRFEVRFERAKLLVKGGAVRDGLKELKKVLKVKPDLAEAHLYMGIALADGNKEAQAVAAFQTAVGKDPKLGEAFFRMGQILSDRRKLGAALHNLKKATALAGEGDPWRDDAFYLLGTTAKLEGQKKVACTAFETYIKIAPAGAAATRRDAEQQLRALGCIKPKPED